MPEETHSSQSGQASLMEELRQMRGFAGAPGDFWRCFLATAARLTAADKIVLLSREKQSDKPWKTLLQWPDQSPPSRMLTAFNSKLQESANRCSGEQGVTMPLEPLPGSAGHYIVAAPVLMEGQKEDCVVVCLLSEVTEEAVGEAMIRLTLATQGPEVYLKNLAVRQAQADVEKFAGVLDLVLVVGAQQRFLAAAMALCNNLATRFKCDRVSIGFLQGGYIRVKAISRIEKFGREMAAVQAIEKTMEESLDQDDEILWPPLEGSNVVARDHQQFAREHGVQHLCSVPLREDKKPVAVVMCERQSGAFNPLETQQLRLACDILSSPLMNLKHRDRWFGARWAADVRARAAKLVGPEHTWAKLLAIFVAVALVVVVAVPVPYRVEGEFVLKSDEMAHLTAPFDGYIHEVLVRPGDRVEVGQKLLSLRTDELQLEESAAIADLTRYQREAEKARAAQDFAEMRINEALVQQVQARLEVVRYRINESTLRSPFSGVLVEGDLRERIGAPVKLADVLMRVARIDTLYVEAEIDERDVHELANRTTGEIAFLSQPRKKFPVKIVNLEQAAFPRTQGNVFQVRCAAVGGVPDWWRPGMSGISKFDVEQRTLLWIFTHRTVDFIRMKLWW